MSEDRPADDQQAGVESAVGLSIEALADLVRLRDTASIACDGEADTA
jgi:hypothetical protein